VGHLSVILLTTTWTASSLLAIAAPAPRFTGACSAYGKEGDAAMVTLADRKKTLLLERKSVGAITLELPPVEAKEIGCSVFINQGNRYVAVALNRLRSESESLHIVVADSVRLATRSGPPLAI